MNEMLSDFNFILSSMRIDRKLTNYSIIVQKRQCRNWTHYSI